MTKDSKRIIIAIIALISIGAIAYFITKSCKKCQEVCFSTEPGIKDCTVICDE